MSTDKMREEFEEWYRLEVMRDAPEDVAAQRFGKDRDGMYWDIWTRRSWQAWQASRAALVVELPPCPQPDLEDAEEANMEMFYALNGLHHAFRAAIKTAGVRVKE